MRGASNSTYRSRRCPPPLKYAVDVKNDVTSRSASDKSIRPLPPIPNIPPPTLATRHQKPSNSPRRIRPLPSVPFSSSASDTSISTGSPEVSHHSTPATSLEDLHHPHLRPVRSLPIPPKSAPLVTNDKLLKTPSSQHIDLNSPSLPMPPTPQTAKRNRVQKHRRQLREPIPDDVLYDHIVARSANTKAQVLKNVQGYEICAYMRAAATVAKILEFSSCDEKDEDDSECSGSSDSREASGEEGKEGKNDLATQEDYPWVLENKTPFRAGNIRYSFKWVREKGARRKTEKDYQRIIEALRVL